ncbi:hypothetical protein [Actinokineospora cianjurensis]|uniref:hypothetical protein n=1 Tax=Actinokineospora cianjurensis TaxID=585224 RepID=UPI0014774280|nr:hypothetical protein [Actinokineospora cianjurensis]
MHQRCGLASAGLATSRIGHPGLSWHTLGDHLAELRAFWPAVGVDVRGLAQMKSSRACAESAATNTGS